MIDRVIATELDGAVDVSTLKTGRREGAVAITESGNIYRGTGINSQTHLLTIAAGHSALYGATQRQDFEVTQLIVKQEKVGLGIDPVLAQVVIDFAYRTGRDMSVTIVNPQNEGVAHVDSVTVLAPHYSRRMPPESPLEYIRNATKTDDPVAHLFPGDLLGLHNLARAGISRAFTTEDGGTRYGAVAITPEGRAYYGGQWGSYDHRTNIHAEMGATMLAIVDGEKEFKELGVVSDKFVHIPTQMCGCCRQFMSEIADEDLSVHRFGLNDGVVESTTLFEYLPSSWSSEHGRE